MPPEDTR